MDLADIAHVDRAPDVDPGGVKAVGQQMAHALGFDVAEQRIQRGIGRIVVEPHGAGRHVVVLDVGNDLAERAEPRGELRQNDGGYSHLAGKGDDVCGSGTTGANQHEIPRIVAALDGDAADAVDHVVV